MFSLIVEHILTIVNISHIMKERKVRCIDMKVHLLSHDEAVLFLPKEGVQTGIIRLFDSEEILGNSSIRNEALEHPERFEYVFEMVVDDIKRDISDEYPGAVLFDNTHAQELLGFFDVLSGMDEVIVHCRAGVSRSAAVAILFVRYLKRLDLECSLYLNHLIHPNSHILSFQSKMGILNWDSNVSPVMKKMERSVLEGDHESILMLSKKLGFNREELML